MRGLFSGDTMKRSLLLVSGSLLIVLQAQAQTMYRCGSVYQDRPCDAYRLTGFVPETRAERRVDEA